MFSFQNWSKSNEDKKDLIDTFKFKNIYAIQNEFKITKKTILKNKILTFFILYCFNNTIRNKRGKKLNTDNTKRRKES